MSLAPPRANQAWVFAGQGAQRPGIGLALLERFPALLDRAEQVLGWSLRELCRSADEALLGQTRYTQPLLYVVGAFDYLDRLSRGCLRPRFLAGHSLGELTALFCAGAYEFETGLRLVARRGELTQGANTGAMVAVLGLPAETIVPQLPPTVGIAADNSATQVTISGPRPALALARERLEAAGAETVELGISGAFHCPMMAHVAAHFAEFLATLDIRDPLVPVLSNVDARPHQVGRVREAIVAQLTAPVRWRACVRWLLDRGVEDFVELGDTELLAKLVSQIQAEVA